MHVPAATLRRMMPSSASPPTSAVPTGHRNQQTELSALKPPQVLPFSRYFEVATRSRFNIGTLIDRGAYGSVGDSDVLVIAYLECYTVCGVDGHRIKYMYPMVGAVVQDQTGDFIAIINQVAYNGKGRTILSFSQMETFGIQVQDRALRDTWTSNNFDCVMTDVDGWERTVSTNNVNPDTRPFDQYSNYKHWHVSMAEVSEMHKDEFCDSIQPCQIDNLHDKQCTVDDLATLHTFEAQFHDGLRCLWMKILSPLISSWYTIDVQCAQESPIIFWGQNLQTNDYFVANMEESRLWH